MFCLINPMLIYFLEVSYLLRGFMWGAIIVLIVALLVEIILVPVYDFDPDLLDLDTLWAVIKITGISLILFILCLIFFPSQKVVKQMIVAEAIREMDIKDNNKDAEKIVEDILKEIEAIDASEDSDSPGEEE